MSPSEGVLPLYYHPDYERMTQTPGHPESPDRVASIMAAARKLGVPTDIRDPVEVTTEDMLLVHDKRHIDLIRDFGVGFMDPDTFHHDQTYQMCIRALGGAVGAAKESVLGRRPTFSVPRPPGHHAGRDYNMGFCYINNVAIAARVLQRDFEDVKRVAIVDIDAHHGNGTNDIFYDDPSVLYISTHQWGIFPGTGHQGETGSGKGIGKTVNLPFIGGAGDPSFIQTYEEVIAPILKAYAPDAVIVSLGGDSHIMDPLTGLTLSTPGYLKLTGSLLDFARRNVSGRISFVLEGGYHTRALGEVFTGTMNLALEEPLPFRSVYQDTRESVPDTGRIREFREVQSSFWGI
jgi:acetoin utilization deacetylase AcuC-like enzyme